MTLSGRTEHIVMFSSGISSAITAERVLRKQPASLLFTDTRFEDEDNYRFLNEVLNYFTREKLEHKYVRLCDGRTPLELFQDEGILGNDRVPVCSRKLKTEQSWKYVKDAVGSGGAVVYFGFDNKEKHRAERVYKRYQEIGAECRFPLCEPPYILDGPNYIISRWQIKPPRMYGKGFVHANCGGRCVRGKLQHWRHLLRVWPERFEQMAKFEREFKGGNYTFLRDYPLDQLRADYESQLNLFDDTKGHAPCLQCL